MKVDQTENRGRVDCWLRLYHGVRFSSLLLLVAFPSLAVAQKGGGKGSGGSGGSSYTGYSTSSYNPCNGTCSGQPGVDGIIDTGPYTAMQASIRQKALTNTAMSVAVRNSASLSVLAEDANKTAHGPRTPQADQDLTAQLKKIEKLSHALLQAEVPN